MQWHTLPAPSEPLICDSPSAWYMALIQRIPGATPFKQAVTGGRLAATPGLAFLAGYQGALRALWPDAPAGIGALCVTEQRITKPADFSSVWQQGLLNGQKGFVLAGTGVSWLLVAARSHDALVIVHVEADASGVEFEPLNGLDLMPDVPHAKVRFTDVSGTVLLGDGWQDYAKPFRTLEDIYVSGAMLAWLLTLADRYDWPEQLKSQLLRLLNSCSFLSTRSAADSITHVILGAVLEQFATLRSAIDQALESAPQTLRETWLRDQRVLDLAKTARDARLTKAQSHLVADTLSS